jgi:hypothetical protein
MLEALEDRLCLSATHHHFHTGVRAHFTNTVTAAAGHSRHHFHTGVRARFSSGTTTPPAAFGTITKGTPGTPGAGTVTGMGGLFGGGGSIFGGGGSIFSSVVPSATGSAFGSSPAIGTGSLNAIGGTSLFSAGPMF